MLITNPIYFLPSPLSKYGYVWIFCYMKSELTVLLGTELEKLLLSWQAHISYQVKVLATYLHYTFIFSLSIYTTLSPNRFCYTGPCKISNTKRRHVQIMKQTYNKLPPSPHSNGLFQHLVSHSTHPSFCLATSSAVIL